MEGERKTNQGDPENSGNMDSNMTKWTLKAVRFLTKKNLLQDVKANNVQDNFFHILSHLTLK